VLVGAHHGAVDHGVLVVGVAGQALEDPFPHAGLGPAAEAGVDLLPGAEPFRQVAPGDAGAVPVQHRLDEQAVVLGRDPDPPLAPGQEVLDPVPLVVPQGVAAHQSVPSWPTDRKPLTPSIAPSIEGTP
jgi:hypothetical protein